MCWRALHDLDGRLPCGLDVARLDANYKRKLTAQRLPEVRGRLCDRK